LWFLASSPAFLQYLYRVVIDSRNHGVDVDRFILLAGLESGKTWIRSLERALPLTMPPPADLLILTIHLSMPRKRSLGGSVLVNGITRPISRLWTIRWQPSPVVSPMYPIKGGLAM